jgi:hypothetical protein
MTRGRFWAHERSIDYLAQSFIKECSEASLRGDRPGIACQMSYADAYLISALADRWVWAERSGVACQERWADLLHFADLADRAHADHAD